MTNNEKKAKYIVSLWLGEMILSKKDWEKIRKLRKEGVIVDVYDGDECVFEIYVKTKKDAEYVKKMFENWPEPVEIRKVGDEVV
ncbi:MAG: hypothetical protein DRJ03_03640 [Chloroflexi bacterium]|nr:MAG: hypothetical protein DRJ03_03640 [Chloroflexota bacterium]